MAEVTFLGNTLTGNGDLPAVGSAAPDFSLRNKHLKDLGLSNFTGKKRLPDR